MACRILVPQPGIEPGATAVKAPSPNYWTARELPQIFTKIFKIYLFLQLSILLIVLQLYIYLYL